MRAKPSKIKLIWVRGADTPSFHRPNVFFAVGIRGAGKSSFLEVIGEHYFYHGANILDIFGARSGEGLAWLRSPWAKETNKILLIRGRFVDVQCSWNAKSWKDLTLNDFETNRIIISASPLYGNINEEFLAVNRIFDLLFKRLGWKKYIYILVREAANLFYSRMKIAENQLLAKNEAAYLIRESRHHGLALGMDTQKTTSVDADLRALIDYLVIKNHGYYSLPRELWWIYRYLDPMWIRNMEPREFAILSRTGAIGIGTTSYNTWHKKPRENLLKTLGIKIEKIEGSELEGEVEEKYIG